MVKIATGMTIPSIGIYGFNGLFANEEQQKTIDDSPAWLRDTYWLVAIPGTNQVARIPKPFELSIFANVTERFLDYAFKHDEDAFDNFINEALAGQAFSVMPNALLPLFEGIANYSIFRDAPIVPQREQGLALASQYDTGTSEVAKGLAAGARFATGEQGPLKNFGSPRVMDYAIRSATGGLGNYALDAIDAFLDFMGITDKVPAPAKNVSQVPLAKAFLVNEGQTGQAMDFVYTERDKLTRERGTFKKTNPDGAYPNEGKLKYLTAVADAIGEMSAEIRDITEAPGISPNDKRDRINKLKADRNDYARAAQEKYGSGTFTVNGYAAVFNVVLTGKDPKTKEEKTVILTLSQHDRYQREFLAEIKERIAAKETFWKDYPPTTEAKKTAIENIIENVRKEMKEDILWSK
jgi:hypothetical protein